MEFSIFLCCFGRDLVIVVFGFGHWRSAIYIPTREAKSLVPWYTSGTRCARFNLNTITSDSPSPESEQQINRKQYLCI
jgi:hypothetical protein